VASSQAFREKVEDRLWDVLPVRSRSMFGGFGFYSDDLFFALIAFDRLYFKVGEADRAACESQGLARFHSGYFEMPAGTFEDDAELIRWVDRALEAARVGK
jgi:DNA transformation protein and related proteins